MKRKAPATPTWLVQRYMETHELTQAAFAAIAEVPQGMVSYWVRGKRPISAKAALAIERNTDGVLSRFDLCPTTFQKDAAA